MVSHVVVTTELLLRLLRLDKEVAESSFTAYCIQQILVKKNVSTTAFYWTSSSARYLLHKYLHIWRQGFVNKPFSLVNF